MNTIYRVGIAASALAIVAVAYMYWPGGAQKESTRAPYPTITVTQENTVAVGFAPATSLPANDTTFTDPLKPARNAPAGQKEYRNEHYRFALFYPNNFSVKTYNEGNNASTFTFANSDNSQSFQIFVVPYGERQVSAERFKLDEPSGVILDPTDILIDQVRGTMFFGNNTVMGDTREVWFIKNGYLFEVTTYKDLDAWLSQIMQTWLFL